MVDQSRPSPNSFNWEDNVDAIGRMNDTTSLALITAISLSTAGAANTANAITDLTKWKDNTLYINSTNGPGTNAGTTGLTVFFETRPASAVGWTPFRTETGVAACGTTAIKIVGSGLATTSGITHFADVRVTIENTTDSSGTATVQAWVLSRTP